MFSTSSLLSYLPKYFQVYQPIKNTNNYLLDHRVILILKKKILICRCKGMYFREQNQAMLNKSYYSQTELDLENHSWIVSKQKFSFSLRKGSLMLRTPCILLTTIFQKQFCLTIKAIKRAISPLEYRVWYGSFILKLQIVTLVCLYFSFDTPSFLLQQNHFKQEKFNYFLTFVAFNRIRIVTSFKK